MKTIYAVSFDRALVLYFESRDDRDEAARQLAPTAADSVTKFEIFVFPKKDGDK